MYFPYGAWKDAEREAKRLPPSNNSFGIIITLLIGGLLVFSCLKVGGLGILFGLAIIIGMIQGLTK
jgi:hypothetical protein